MCSEASDRHQGLYPVCMRRLIGIRGQLRGHGGLKHNPGQRVGVRVRVRVRVRAMVRVRVRVRTFF